MRIAYITAGAAGMFCGSCLHDNTLVSALIDLGHDALLIPTYTPIRTDETDVSQKRIFFGGINVYLQQKYTLFRRTPWLLDRLLDARGLLRWVSRFAVNTRYEDLGELTISMLRGMAGNQKKEIDKLVTWLAIDFKPEIVTLTNVLLSGMVPEIKRRLGVPVLAALQGDDIFLEALPASHREKVKGLISDNCNSVDGFLATSAYYADFMSEYLKIPRSRIDVVLPGLNLKGHGEPRAPSSGGPVTIGYFARICPEKGLHQLAEAFRLLQQTSGVPPVYLRVSGWLGSNQHEYFQEIRNNLSAAGLGDRFQHVDCPDHASKLAFFRSIDLLSVPTTYRDPKGLYVLEALANAVPVVQPRHGAFPEIVEATGGGILVEPGNPSALAQGLRALLEDSILREALGQRGKEAVFQRFDAASMAQTTLSVFRKYLG